MNHLVPHSQKDVVALNATKCMKKKENIIDEKKMVTSQVTSVCDGYDLSGLYVWFQNRRAKFRKQERLAQQKATSNSSEGSNTQSSVKSETNGTTKSSISTKDIKPGSPNSGVSTTPNSNTSISSHQSSNGDIKPMNGKYLFIISKLLEDSLLSNNNKWSSMSPQSCNTALLVHQANKVLSSQPSHLQIQTHSSHHAAAAAAAALSAPFSSLLGAGGGAASYLLGDHLKPTTNHLF
ncbi:hypothetical protein FQA39_LY12575 [Lamprigera yunnana]|nr:hypothetical protein FQA39_LY12575 [Lamprigera yunnana]